MALPSPNIGPSETVPHGVPGESEVQECWELLQVGGAWGSTAWWLQGASWALSWGLRDTQAVGGLYMLQ